MHLSSIRLDSPVNMIIVVVLTLLAIIAVPWFWDRWKRKRLWRSATILLAVVLTVVSTGMAGNMIGGFFPTVGSLLGTGVYSAQGTDAEASQNGEDLEKLRDTAVAHAREGKGTVVHMKVTGRRTKLTRDVTVYLPPQYFDPTFKDLKFPVIEWIPNYPSGPEVVTGGYHLPEQLDAAIGKRVLAPTVVIVPDPTGVPKVGHDTECVDEVNGTANDTYLTADLRDWALQKLGAAPDRRAWTMAGWSSGGYCAMNLVTRHPQWYGQAVSVSGYDKAQVDAETEDLFHGRQDINDANNVRLNVRLHPSPVDILAIAGDKESYESYAIDQIRLAVRPPLRFSSWRIPDAGHNMNTFKSQLPDLLAWIGAHSTAPAPPVRQVETTGGVQPWPLPRSGAHGALADTDQ
ncbi:alpha/beta hydrolase-fold protein [Amycolatopsis sp., V23-08]|uniref:Alpha/beta hydrolase-fold protein n=1 Tax=Amycolatopsis heterodermiae TaxID=3110235 RepID=A0ABU5R7T5_9PSEU|nr:alpha/beta hydrolase-fold protein [Amycolatopsis sp., V23-08]MEA5361720.1 alpha/beta hydrolase-fold protein [Amycolatopsis sp., V23-08]